MNADKSDPGKLFRKIVAASDGSDSGMNALKEAFVLARLFKSWLTAVSVTYPYYGDLESTWIGDINSALAAQNTQMLSKIRSAVDDNCALMKVIGEYGEPCEKIIQTAVDENADLIVLGRRGLRKIDRALMGSVTGCVVTHSPVDVLVIPMKSMSSFKNILVPVDGSECCAHAVERAVNIAKKCSSSVEFVSVIDLPDEFYAEAISAVDSLIAKAKANLQSALNKAEQQGVAATFCLKEGETYKEIVSRSVELCSDIIIMGSHGRRGIKKMIIGSTAQKVIGYAACPVLVVKNEAAIFETR